MQAANGVPSGKNVSPGIAAPGGRDHFFKHSSASDRIDLRIAASGRRTSAEMTVNARGSIFVAYGSWEAWEGLHDDPL